MKRSTICLGLLLQSALANAEMLKCVNDKGDLAFSDRQCPAGYRVYAVEQGTGRAVPSYGLSPDSGTSYRSPTNDSGGNRPAVYRHETRTDELDKRAEEQRLAEARQAERLKLIDMERDRLRSKLDGCPPMTNWGMRMACQDRINSQLKKLESNPEQYFYDVGQLLPTVERLEAAEGRAAAAEARAQDAEQDARRTEMEARQREREAQAAERRAQQLEHEARERENQIRTQNLLR